MMEVFKQTVMRMEARSGTEMVRMRRVVISAVSDEFALRLAAGSWDLAISDTKLPLLGSLPLRKYAL